MFLKHGFVAEFVKLIVWFQYSRVKNEDEITWSKNANPWKTRTMYGWRRKTKRITGWKWPKLNLTVHYHFVLFMPFKLFTRFEVVFAYLWRIFRVARLYFSIQYLGIKSFTRKLSNSQMNVTTSSCLLINNFIHYVTTYYNESYIPCV